MDQQVTPKEYVKVTFHWKKSYVGRTATVIRREGSKVVVRIWGSDSDRRLHFLSAKSVEALTSISGRDGEAPSRRALRTILD